MLNSKEILRVHDETFKANLYTKNPFRVIGLIDVSILYIYGEERVTLAYYRSSGTNNGKCEGLWYPIVGIKMVDGSFTEFTKYINYVLYKTTSRGKAGRGWLAKSLFFYRNDENIGNKGFSSGIYYEDLLKIGKLLMTLYDEKLFQQVDSLVPESLNCRLC